MPKTKKNIVKQFKNRIDRYDNDVISLLFGVQSKIVVDGRFTDVTQKNLESVIKKRRVYFD